MGSLSFLKKILPKEGYYCATVIEEGKAQNKFFNSIGALNNFIRSYNDCGDVYHACASFQTPKLRTAKNTHLFRCFRADIDVGEEKNKYATLEEAFGGLRDYIEATNLPWPTVIGSGRGLHIYWTLTKDIDINVFTKYSQALKNSFVKYGFKIDPKIPTDAARVLRTPGTINSKNGAVVELVYTAEDVELSTFNLLLINNREKEKEKKTFELVSYDPIFKGCKQFQQFFDGDIEQTGETWISCGRILAQCTNGEQLWHELSAQDERYNYEEANKKWKDSIAFNNATTCAHFKTINPDGCAGCPQRIKTPIHLSRNKQSFETVEGNIRTLPRGYRIDNGRLVFVTKKKEDDEETINEVHPYPIYVDSVNKGEFSRQHSIQFVKCMPCETDTVEVTTKDLYTNSAGSLAEVDIIPTNLKLFMDYVRQSHVQAQERSANMQAYESFGWKGDKFLYGEYLYSFDNKKGYKKEKVALAGDAKTLAPHMQPGGKYKKGSLDGYMKGIQSFYAKGHEWQMCTVISAWSAPVLAYTTANECGIFLSLHEMCGGTGKTTATKAATSAFCDFAETNSGPGDSLVARLAKIGTFCNLPVAMDEMPRGDPEVTYDTIRHFTVGNEKVRLKTSALQGREPRKWKTVVVSNSNSELIGALLATNKSMAISDRIIEIQSTPLPLGKGKLDLQLKKAFDDNPGWAAEPILKIVLKRLDEIKEYAPQFSAAYMKKMRYDPKFRYKADFMAAFHITLAMLVEENFLNVNVERYVDYMFNAIMNGSLERYEVALTPEKILAMYMRQNAGNTLTTEALNQKVCAVIGNFYGKEVKIRRERDTRQIFIPQMELRKFVQTKDISWHSFTTHLEETGLLKAKSFKKNLGAGTVHSTVQEYTVVFKADHYDIIGKLPEEDEETNIIQLPKRGQG